MDSIKVEYSGRTKESSKNDKIPPTASRPPTKYVFRPEVVRSLPKYSQSATYDGKQSAKNLFPDRQRSDSSGNGLRGLFDRVTRQSSEIKTRQEHDCTENRKRSRSLFLAHDHSKEHGRGITEHKSGKSDHGKSVKLPQQDVTNSSGQVDFRLRNSLERVNDEHSRLSENKHAVSVVKHRCPIAFDQSGAERDGSLTHHLETCREEYRENGKLCCSRRGSKQHDDRHNHISRNSEGRSLHHQENSSVKAEDGGRLNKSCDESLDHECRSCPRHHRIRNAPCGQYERSSCDDCHALISRAGSKILDPNVGSDKYKSVRRLRRVDSPYPCTNHFSHLSPTRDVTIVDALRYKLSACRSTQDDTKRTTSPDFHEPSKTVKAHKDCDNCENLHSPSTDGCHIYSASHEKGRATGLEDEKSKTKKYDLVTKTGNSSTSGLLYRSRSSPQLSIHDSGLGSGNEPIPSRPASRLVTDMRQLLTLKQHYYPEAGWGWVIVVVGVLVQILSHGIHGSSGVIVQQIEIRFQTEVYLQSDFGVNCRYIAQCTIRQHYYPESGWGWVVVVAGVLVQIMAAGIHGAAGIWLVEGMRKYRQSVVNVGWLGAMSTGVALLVSPVTIAFCRKKSTRVTAVLGGLVTALGCLFTSFASQFHQLFFSYGTVVGIGVGMTRDCSTLMVAQYFKRRREFVEIFIVSGSGLGIAVMSAFIKGAISNIGWRLGLQAVTGVVFLTFILGTFYRSASLYHPQRRAILHLKNQKRKIKDKNRADDRPPFFDFSTLKSKTVRILLVSTGISAFGINTPIFYLAHQAEEEGLGDTVILLQTYLGLAWTLGCVAFGLLVVHHNVECRIARQYLTQTAVFMCGLCILALTAVHGNYHGYVMFTWIYGIFCGGYHYSLKMYTYERVRARNFARTWGFVQCSQAIPIAIGVPISGYMNVGCGGKAGYYFSSTCVLVGSFTLFFIDLHRRNLSRHKHTRTNGTRHLCVSDNCPQRRKLSFSQEPENEGGAAGAAAAALVLGAELTPGQGEIIDALGADKPELTCISEEGIADMDLPDNLLDDLDYIGDCITSCNKVENYLMLSEFENNLIAEMPIIMDRKGRRWSLARSKQGAQGSQSGNGNNGNNSQSTVEEDEEAKLKWRLAPAPVPNNNRVITVIDEAST